MSKKAILNVSSRKKRDTMLYWTNQSAAGISNSYSASPAVISGGTSTPSCFLFCATARDNEVAFGGNPGTIFDTATRSSTTCFMRGISERIEIQVDDGLPWQWRRICFTAKGLQLITTQSDTFGLWAETPGGYQRVVNQLVGDNNTAIESYIFKGVKNADWVDPLTAPLDNSRISVKYDKTITIASGNEDGVIRKYNRWMPMNHNLVYDDDEAGGGKAGDRFSVQGKAGMGDYYIMDYFRPRDGSNGDNHLQFAPQATLYWHEK